ncbi:MAG: PAS domain S-box protein [Verrucomicrobiales bacterium]|nr:PAS domain S-box protein [Verrucomicrobiales bacterium]
MVSQSYDQLTVVRAFVINRDAQARRLVCQQLLMLGYGVCECDSPLFALDEYEGQSLVVVDVHSDQDEVRDFLQWLADEGGREKDLGEGRSAYVVALATGLDTAWAAKVTEPLWDELLVMPEDLGLLAERFEQIGAKLSAAEGEDGVLSLDVVSPFELADESASLAVTADEVVLSPSRIEDLKRLELSSGDARSANLPGGDLLREMVEGVPFGVVVLGRDEKFVYGNAQHADLLGLAFDEAESVADWFARVSRGAEHCRKVVASWRKHVWQKQLVRTYDLRNKEGRIVDVEFVPKLLSDGALLITMSDVTERCRSEDAWLLSDVKFRTLFAHRGLGMVLVDRTGRICTVNPTLQQMLGYAMDDLKAMAFEDLVVAQERVEMGEFVDLAKKEDCFAGEELALNLHKKDGETLRVMLTLSFMDEKSGPFTAYLVRPDRSSGETAGVNQNALKESMLQNRALLELMPGLVLLFDHTGRVEDVREEGLGEGDEIAGLDVGALPKTYLEESLPEFWKACEKAGVTEMEFHSAGSVELGFALADGSEARAQVAGCVQGHYIAVISATEKTKQVEAASELQQSFAGEEDWSSCEWVDQLQTLISLLNLEINAMPVDSEQEQRSVLEKHQARIRAIACLRDAVIEPAESDRDLVAVPTYLKLLVEESLRSSAQAIELNLEADVDCVALALPLRQCFALGLCVTELMSNAIEHGLANLPDGRIYVRLRRSDREAVLLVGDNGEGLPTGFDLDRVESLGFRVVKSLANQLGARLQIRPGENTEFLIRFPIA